MHRSPRVGEKPPDTWDDLPRVGRPLKKLGHPVGIAISQCTDAEQIYFHQTPAGPRGRQTVANLRSMGVWKFSKMAEFGKDIIRHLFNEERYIDYVTSSDNCNHPIFKKFETHPVWNSDPKYEPLKTIGQYSHLYTWPAAPDPKAQIVIYNYAIANMYAKADTERPLKRPSPGLRGKLNGFTNRASREE